MATSRNPYRSTDRVFHLWGSRTGPQPVKRQRFDVDSGQMFTETVVKARKTQTDERTRLDNLFYEAMRKRGPGPPSLESIAVRSFLRNIDSVTSETLMGLPWELGAELWRQIECLDLARPSVWAAFAAAYPEEEIFNYYRSSEITPTKTFPEYIEFLSCPNFEWLTCLTLSKINLERCDIMRVSELSNLLAMDVYSSSSDLDQEHAISISVVDDQVVRNWGRRAQECGSFSKLRVMILRNQRHLTVKSVEYLCAFPSLTLFGVSGCSVSAKHEHTAQLHGWTLDDDMGILMRIKKDIDKSHTWDGALGACVKYSNSLLSGRDNSGAKDPPILSYRLGPTSSNVLYSVPLVFFRCFDRDIAVELPGLDTEADQSKMQPLRPETPQDQVPRGHLDKKRKIKVSAQRSFDSTLAELGVDIIPRSTIPSKSTSDPSIDQENTTPPRPAPKATQSFPNTPSSATSATNVSLAKRRQARQERERPWRQSPGTGGLRPP